jgi:hypothetical protein
MVKFKNTMKRMVHAVADTRQRNDNLINDKLISEHFIVRFAAGFSVMQGVQLCL